jgi:hypothetical protein
MLRYGNSAARSYACQGGRDSPRTAGGAFPTLANAIGRVRTSQLQFFTRVIRRNPLHICIKIEAYHARAEGIVRISSGQVKGA